MVNFEDIFSHQPPAVNGRARNWTHILWREWRNCHDEEYARHLFDLVIDEPADWRATAILVLLGVIYGALGGLLMTLLLYSENLRGGLISSGIVLGMIVGGTGGLSVALVLKLGQWSSWDKWLQGVIPTRVLTSKSQEKFFNSPLYAILVIGLSGGLGTSITGALFFGQSNLQFFYGLMLGLFAGLVSGFSFNRLGILTSKLSCLLLGVFMMPFVLCYLLVIASILFDSSGPLLGISVGLFAAYLLEFFSGRNFTLIGRLLGISVALCFGLFFGLGFAQFIGLLFGPLDVLNSVQIMGLAVGIAIGAFFGRGSGLIGTLVWQAIFTLIVLANGLNPTLLSWLFGLLIGGVMGSLSQMISPERRVEFAEVYQYRAGYFWWYKRPPAAEIELALHSSVIDERWTELLNRLAKRREQPEGTTILRMAALQSTSWIDRFIARHVLVTLGDKALPHLLTILDTPSDPRQRIAFWLIRSIGHETKIRLVEQAERVLCPDCLTCCGPHKVNRPGFSITYYGCRTCGQTRQFLHCPQGATAVLGTDSANAKSRPNGLLRVNWLTRRTLFDFNQVEIIQATDEDVERFAVQIGNDTDPLRQPRYSQMQCHIAPTCALSENTMRILQHTFGQVERRGEFAC